MREKHEMKKQKMLSNSEIASFCKQTAWILKAGITPAEGMEILINDTISKEGKELLQQIDLEQLSEQLHAELKGASGQKKARIVKRLEVVDAFRISGNKPEWMIIDVLPVIPPVEEFPYAIRVVSEVVSSNGSTSQGSICGSTLALMDAGVPIKAPVAGISCGLIQDGDDFTTFIDIQGVEDFHGEMDFKVAGTKKGITAIQMDLKNDGLTMAIIKNALDITYDARVQILDQIMLPCIAEPRPEVSPYAPKMITMKIDPDRIREVIGKGGSVIQKIVADTGAKIDIDDDGTIHIASADAAACDAAKKCIDDIVFVPEVGKLYYGKVVRIIPIGAFIELAPGKDGMCHIKDLEFKRTEKVEDVLNVGDMTWVKVTEIDDRGRVNLSRKEALKERGEA